jgi:hypothetical protein
MGQCWDAAPPAAPSAGCHVQPAEAIMPSSEEQWAGVLEVAKWALVKSAKLARTTSQA